MIEVVTISVYMSKEAPFSGTGVVVVLEKFNDRVKLLHPVSLESWVMPMESRSDDQGKPIVEGYDQSLRDVIWPENKCGFKFDGLVFSTRLKAQAEKQAARGIKFDVAGVARIVSDLNPSEKFERLYELLNSNIEKGETSMATKKGKTKKEVKQRGGSRILTLSAGTDAKDYKEGSHGWAVVKALTAMGQGSVAEITDHVVKKELLGKSKMNPKAAISWMSNKLFNEKKLKKAGVTESVAEAASE